MQIFDTPEFVKNSSANCDWSKMHVSNNHACQFDLWEAN